MHSFMSLFSWYGELSLSIAVYFIYVNAFNICLWVIEEHFLQIVATLAVIVYKFYGDALREMFGYEEHPYAFYTTAGITLP